MSQQQNRILMIDFDTSLSAKLAEYLVRSGYLVDIIHSEHDLSLFFDTPSSSNDFDLVMTELELRDRSGMDVLSFVKAHSAHTPVVLCSAGARAKEVVYALRLGADNYILKPLGDFSFVGKVIEAALTHGRLALSHAKAQDDLKRLNSELQLSMAELQRDQTAGRLVQQQFLPPSPVALGDLNVSFEIIPSLYLSGDSVDYGFMASRYLAFYLMDVSGHGSASAFVTVWVKQLVRGMFRDQNLFRTRHSFENDIPELMQRLNADILKAGIGPHLTCFVGVIDTLTLDFNYVVGGHLPLPLLLQGERARYLSGKGKPLGLFERATWEVNHCKLEKAFSLVVFSDGVLELFEQKDLTKNEIFLKETVESIHPADLDQLKAGLPLQNRDTVPDDVAMLLIRRNHS